ncbi:hypothetical protein [Mesorhizobium sp. YM1C-6-2]|uniref:hypothetical protein n=1 Tax=Mesorhizobium sp. YM1C-6-2 TaxID=1827501 RepID=UPI000EF204EA|nr:hypothetical protein [Mesorhizobium sp. YM1C-6-2]RLP22910.1 hypothetical protein D8676_21900 [Mesorhizobium sp. YM1C-6-2]
MSALVDRRRLLLGLAAASAAAAAPVPAEAGPAENPELIRLGDMLSDAYTRYNNARHAANAVKATQPAVSEAEYEPYWRAVKAAVKSLCSLVATIMDQPDETMAGLLIKAEALATFGNMTDVDQGWAIFEPNKWHGQIAASILRHAKGGAS